MGLFTKELRWMPSLTIYYVVSFVQENLKKGIFVTKNKVTFQ